MTTRIAAVPGRGLVTLHSTADPTVWLADSRTVSGRKYRIQGVGSAAPSCTCPARVECAHILATYQMLQEAHMSELPEAVGQTTALATRPATVTSIDARRGNMQSAQGLALAAKGQVEGYREYLYLAREMWEGRLFPESIKTPQAAAALMLRASELGVPPMAALELFYVVGNKVAIQGQMIGALIERSGKGWVEIVESTEERCTVRGHREGRPSMELTWTRKDAEAAGSKPMGGWKDKLVWKATARIGRRMFADVLGGMDVADGNGVVVDYGIVPEQEGEYRRPEIEAPRSEPQTAPARRQYPWGAAMKQALADSPYEFNQMYQHVGDYLAAYLPYEVEDLPAAIDDYLLTTSETSGRTVTPHDLVNTAIDWHGNGRPDVRVNRTTEPEPELAEAAEFREESAPQDTLFDLPDPIVEPAQPPRHG